MQEGKRQKQVGGLLQEELSTIFQRMGLTMMEGGMVSIVSVKITPDLLEARVYLSIFQANAKAVMQRIEETAWEIKKQLAAKVKGQLRRIPELKFYHDDTLEHAFRMEEIFRQISKYKEGNDQNQQQ